MNVRGFLGVLLFGNVLLAPPSAAASPESVFLTVGPRYSVLVQAEHPPNDARVAFNGPALGMLGGRTLAGPLCVAGGASYALSLDEFDPYRHWFEANGLAGFCYLLSDGHGVTLLAGGGYAAMRTDVRNCLRGLICPHNRDWEHSPNLTADLQWLGRERLAGRFGGGISVSRSRAGVLISAHVDTTVLNRPPASGRRILDNEAPRRALARGLAAGLLSGAVWWLTAPLSVGECTKEMWLKYYCDRDTGALIMGYASGVLLVAIPSAVIGAGTGLLVQLVREHRLSRSRAARSP
ncbi:MAG: hypothetical protein D6761_12500 [Candidatus Dadabacteria bacterium]|nr:MAG: hypothetical protein D6761_12500 [Candidatus Dadabacteria bacterium]